MQSFLVSSQLISTFQTLVLLGQMHEVLSLPLRTATLKLREVFSE